MAIAKPIDWPARYAAIYAWAFAAVAITTRWADQNAARPDYPYVLLDIINQAKEGGVDEIRRTTDLLMRGCPTSSWRRALRTI